MPPPAVAVGLPFRPTVARWRPLVEAELGRLRAARTLDPMLTPALLLTLIEVEWGGDPYAVSGAKALGLMQLVPSTFATYEGPTADPLEPAANIRAGTLHLDELRRRQGDLRWALAGSNAGLTASLRARAGEARLVTTTDAFVTRVTTLFARTGTSAAAATSAGHRQ